MAANSKPPRDHDLIDALDKRKRVVYDGPCWRAVRDGRDPLPGSRSGGRWDDGTFDVLYTSMLANGATAEIFYHLSRGQPIFPSQVRYRIHELSVALKNSLRFLAVPDLSDLGVRAEDYGRMSYVERQQEYLRTQDIAETTFFLGCDGLIVPNGRWDCLNLVVFTERSTPQSLMTQRDHGLIDWDDWRARSALKV